MKKILILLFLSISIVIKATNYYVSPTGSDSNNGTTSPFLTVKHACDVATASGDIINVAAGTYTVTAQCNLSPGVSIAGQGATSVLLAGYASSPLLNMVSSSEGTNGNQSVSNLKFDGNNLTGNGAINIYARSNIKVHDCTFINFQTYGIRWFGTAGGSDNEPGTYATGNEFYNNTVTNCAIYNGGGYNELKISGQAGALVYNNTLTQTGRATGQNGWPIAGRWDKGLKIYNNAITKEPYDGATFDFAIELWSMQGLEIYNNTIVGSTDLNMLAKGSYSYSVDYHDNIVGPASMNTSHYENGMQLEAGCSDVIVRNNRFKNLFGGVYVYAQAGSKVFNNINIYNNVADASRLLYFLSADNSSALSNINVWNNTCKMGAINLGDAIELPDIGTANGVSVRNNIAIGYNRSPVFAFSQKSGVSISNVSIENNDFYSNGNSNNPLYNSIAPTNVTLANNIVTNPLLVSTTDFHLQGTSPVINKGLNVGLPFSGSAPDLGAFETQLTTVAVNPVYSGSTVENTTPSVIGMNYNLTLASTLPPATAFGVMVNSVVRVVNTVAVSGTQVLLTLASPVVKGDVITVAYTAPASNPLQSTSGGPAATMSAKAVTNNVSGAVTLPVFVSSVIQNATPGSLEITYSLSQANIVPAATAFKVLVNNVSRSVSTVTVSGTKVTLTLASPVIFGDVATVAYTKPATSPLQTTSGAQVESFSAQSVVNGVIAVINTSVATVKMTVTPNPVHKIINVGLDYTGSTPAQIAALSPQNMKIYDNYGKLYINKSLVTGVTSFQIPINLRSGVYNVQMLSTGVVKASQKIIVYR